MSDLTDPRHYHDAATVDEAHMRADFARVCLLRHHLAYTDSLTESEQLLSRAAEIECRWSLPDGSLCRDWVSLCGAVSALLGPRTPAIAGGAAVISPVIGHDTVLSIQHRNRDQAAEIVAWIWPLSTCA